MVVNSLIIRLMVAWSAGRVSDVARYNMRLSILGVHYSGGHKWLLYGNFCFGRRVHLLGAMIFFTGPLSTQFSPTLKKRRCSSLAYSGTLELIDSQRRFMNLKFRCKMIQEYNVHYDYQYTYVCYDQTESIYLQPLVVCFVTCRVF